MRRRRNINVAVSALRMIERLSRDKDWNSDISPSDLIEIHKLADQAIEALSTPTSQP